MVDDVCVRIRTTSLILVIHLRLHPTRAYGIHSHSTAAPLHRERSGETDQSMLARVVRRSFRHTLEARNGGHIDNGSRTSLHHRPAVGLAQHERCDKIDVEHLAVRLTRRIERSLDHRDSRIVDERIDVTKRVEHLASTRLDDVLIGDVPYNIDSIAIARDINLLLVQQR